VVQAVFGFSLLEVVNYLEHYGLLRQKDETAATSAAQPRTAGTATTSPRTCCSTSSSATPTTTPTPPAATRCCAHFDEAPQLPSGYGLMIGLAYVPPLWRRVMDPRVLAQYDGDITLVNVDPRKRDRIYARYGAAPSRSGPTAAPA
jgi:alkane 1-monooxygenase